VQESDCYSDFLQSSDGRQWQRLSMISTERMSSEVAFDFLPDGRAVAFVRHDLDQYPEIKVAEPPYTEWETVLAFPFRCTGPSLDLIHGHIVLSGRVYFDDPATPLLTPAIAARGRGLLLMTLDLERRKLLPEVMIPHSTGPLAPHDPLANPDPRFNGPDISYASAVALGSREFAMSYYDGYGGWPASIRMLRASMD
jgi:hypothetical protein